MTAYRMPISGSLPPTANFWARFVGDGSPEEYPLQAFVLHLIYGAAGGALFGTLFSDTTTGSDSRVGIELRDLLSGLGFGLGGSLFGTRVVLGRLVGMDLSRDEALIFHVGHLIYGVTLGAWLGSNR
jgi:hypothetical protein